MTIESKFKINQIATYYDGTVHIIGKRYDPNKNEWMYEVRNRRENFQAWVKESELK